MLNNTANKYLNFAITSIYPINAAISYSPSRPVSSTTLAPGELVCAFAAAN